MKNSKIDLKKFEKYIEDTTGKNPSIVFRNLKILDNKILVVFDESLCDVENISDFAIRSIKKCVQQETKLKDNISKINNLRKLFLEKLDYGKIKELDLSKDDVFFYIFSGFALIVTEDGGVLALEVKNSAINRSVKEPTTENSLNGPKDAFVEAYSQNIGLIKKRIKTEKLRINEIKVGRNTKTKVGMLYIDTVAKKELIDKVKKELSNIDIDGIIDSNMIRELSIPARESTIFPTVISTERPDTVSYYLLEGRVAVVVENSPNILVYPAFISDYFKTMDDYYQKSNSVVTIRLIRYIAFFLTLVTPAIYIALTTFNQEAIPTSLLISFATQREGVPAPAFIEALMMIVAFEIMREGDIRVPTISGSTLSIVGALILGDAAVSAGIVSPIMIIVIAITTISSLIFSDINLVNALRIWRIILLLLAAISGIVGVILGSIMFIVKIASINIEGMPYTYPFAPMDINKLESDTISRKSVKYLTKRNPMLSYNLTKQIEKKEE